jgi:hypothetical protein
MPGEHRAKRNLNVKLIGGLSAGIVIVALAAAQASKHADDPSEVPPRTRLAESPEAIYSNSPDDSWNRIFYYLFSRLVTACLTADFPEGEPFREVGGLLEFLHLQVSTRTIEIKEVGDRAIDPLYPAFPSDDGSRVVLEDPGYAGFRKSLQDALADSTVRSAVARAIMQNDLWSAHDIIYREKDYKQRGEDVLAQRRLEILELLGRLIHKIGLTPDEIRSLPDNYSTAKAANSLPDVFKKDSGWVEVRWFPQRLHDFAVDYRRVARVFLKPARPQWDMQRFLNGFRRGDKDTVTNLDGVALVVQPLIIDTKGQLRAVNLSTDVPFRMFEKTTQGPFQKTQIGIYELSRKRWMLQTDSGGLEEKAESERGYLPAAGNDYGFASPDISKNKAKPPLAVKQGTRCRFCHGESSFTQLMTFSVKRSPKEGLGPPVRQLNPLAHEAADFVISEKEKREDWKTLRGYFQR